MEEGTRTGDLGGPDDVESEDATIHTSEDAQAYYDAARFRFEYQEQNRARYSARVQQLLVILVAIGAAMTQLVEVALKSKSDGWPTVLLTLTSVLAIVVLATFVLVALVGWSATYKALPDKAGHERTWAEAGQYHETHRLAGSVVTRKALLCRQMALGLLSASDHNMAVDKTRERNLDRAKWGTAVAGVLLSAGVIVSLARFQHDDPKRTHEADSGSGECTCPEGAPGEAPSTS